MLLHVSRSLFAVAVLLALLGGVRALVPRQVVVCFVCVKNRISSRGLTSWRTRRAGLAHCRLSSCLHLCTVLSPWRSLLTDLFFSLSSLSNV
jgi:hypothetical protein